MVDKIGNRWFGEQLQFYLHEWGKHTLGHLRFTQLGVSKCDCDDYQYQQLDYPQTAMPENIKFRKLFQIYHFDNEVFNFFRRIQSLLTTDTMLEIRYIHTQIRTADRGQVRNVRTILGHLLPLIDGVHTIKVDDRMLPIVKSMPRLKFHQIKVFRVELTRFVQSTAEPIMEWLTASNEPKLLQLYYYGNDIRRQVMDAIRKQFMEAKEPSTFAVIFPSHWDFTAFHCENTIGEQLCGMPCEKFTVFRHQANNAEAGDQLRQWVDANTQTDNREQYIQIERPTIGPERIFVVPDLDENESDDEKDEGDEKPSTSKKRRICK